MNKLSKSTLTFPDRIGRVKLINLSAAFYFIFLAGVFISVFTSIFLIGIFGAFYFYAMVKLNNARLHDFNRSGWWNLTIFVPGINFILCLLLLFYPGTKGENEYGEEPKYPSLFEEILAFISLVAMFISSLFFSFIQNLFSK
jgi:uncharacterized membrane protein YhaH (DUF805 family)